MSYTEEKDTCEPTSAIIHLCKMINTIHKDHLQNLIATLSQKNSTLPMANPTAKLVAKSLKATKRIYGKT